MLWKFLLNWNSIICSSILDNMIKKSTGLPVSIAENPLNSVVMGCGKCLDNLDKVKNLLTSAY